MKHLHALLTILSDGKLHSGEELGKHLGVTRSAIWKVFQQLPGLGIKLASAPKKGYCLEGGLELLDQGLILQALSKNAQQALYQLEILETTISTNTHLLEAARHGAVSGSACIAEHQAAGKGRRGRVWHSPYGRNIYLSVLWRFANDPSAVTGLSLAIGVAVVRALEKYGMKQGLGLKWPNDVMWEGQKLAGTLIELFGESYETTCVIIGVGLNVGMPKNFHQKTDLPWTDMASILGEKPARNRLAGLLLSELLTGLQEFQREGFASFLESYQCADGLAGKAVKVILPTEEVKGVAAGIGAQGEFLLKMPDASIKPFMHGEVSVRIAK